MRPPLRILAMLVMLLYGSGLAAALHRATHHPPPTAASSCAGHDGNETPPSQDPLPPENDHQSDDCPECLLLLTGGAIPPMAPAAPALEAETIWTAPAAAQPPVTSVNRQSRPRAPPRLA